MAIGFLHFPVEARLPAQLAELFLRNRFRTLDIDSDLPPIFDRHQVGMIIDMSSESLSTSLRNGYRDRPESAAHRAAMKRLAFLVGRWAGEVRLQRRPGKPILLTQTEVAQFKLDGLILLTEGIGRAKADGKPILHALGIVSYDDEAGEYRMRAFNDGENCS